MSFEKFQAEINCDVLFKGIPTSSLALVWSTSALVHEVCTLHDSFFLFAYLSFGSWEC